MKLIDRKQAIYYFDKLSEPVCHENGCKCGGNIPLLSEDTKWVDDDLKVDFMKWVVVQQLENGFKGLTRLQIAWLFQQKLQDMIIYGDQEVVEEMA